MPVVRARENISTRESEYLSARLERGMCHVGGLARGGVSKQVTLEQDLKEVRQQDPRTLG